MRYEEPKMEVISINNNIVTLSNGGTGGNSGETFQPMTSELEY